MADRGVGCPSQNTGDVRHDPRRLRGLRRTTALSEAERVGRYGIRVVPAVDTKFRPGQFGRVHSVSSRTMRAERFNG
jgi:hypothetical protein